jgi:hypothetical protein
MTSNIVFNEILNYFEKGGQNLIYLVQNSAT